MESYVHPEYGPTVDSIDRSSCEHAERILDARRWAVGFAAELLAPAQIADPKLICQINDSATFRSLSSIPALVCDGDCSNSKQTTT